MVHGQRTLAHRFIHFVATGEWPEIVRHTCDNKRCINRDHLIGGTYKDNYEDWVQRRV